jgi:hypothetical protein
VEKEMICYGTIIPLWEKVPFSPVEKTYPLRRTISVGRNNNTIVEATTSYNHINNPRNVAGYGTLPENAHVAEYVL